MRPPHGPVPVLSPGEVRDEADIEGVEDGVVIVGQLHLAGPWETTAILKGGLRKWVETFSSLPPTLRTTNWRSGGSHEQCKDPYIEGPRMKLHLFSLCIQMPLLLRLT